MKFLSLTLIASALSTAVFAQTPVTDTMDRHDSTLIMSPVSGGIESSQKAFNNEVKLNVFSLFLGNISLQYERAITPKFTAALGLRMGPERPLPFSGMLEKVFDGDTLAKELIGGTRQSNYAITPEIRYYFGKGHMRGFYAGLFGRFGKFSLSMPFTINDAGFANGKQSVLLTGDYSYGGAGLQLGTKFVVSKRVTIDWFFLGPMFSTGTINLNAATDLSSMTASGQSELVEEMLDTFGEATVDNQGIRVKASQTIPGYRTGLSVGFRF